MAVPTVSVALRKGTVYVASTYSPGPGTYIEKEPAFVATSHEAGMIGQNVLDGLTQFAEDGPWPVDWTSYQSPVVALAGVASWSEFERGSKQCVVDLSEDYLRIRSDNAHIRLSPMATPEEIGIAALEAMGTSVEREKRKHSSTAK